MPKSVSGFLANDGSFFEDEPECKRHEVLQVLAGLCETHETNFENFLAMLNGWQTLIKEYYDANDKCKAPLEPETFDTTDDLADAVERGFRDKDISHLSAFLPTEGDNPNDPSRDKDAPGFLEQQIRKHQ